MTKNRCARPFSAICEAKLAFFATCDEDIALDFFTRKLVTGTFYW
jgi:hypothetical protein